MKWDVLGNDAIDFRFKKNNPVVFKLENKLWNDMRSSLIGKVEFVSLLKSRISLYRNFDLVGFFVSESTTKLPNSDTGQKNRLSDNCRNLT